MTNPGEHFLSQLRKKQKALKLTDSDIEINEGAATTAHHTSRQEDLEFYAQAFQEMAQRQIPIHDSDRHELDYFQRVFKLRDEEVFAIEQQVMTEMGINSNPNMGRGSTYNEPGAMDIDEMEMAPSSDPAASQEMSPTLPPQDSFGGEGSDTPTLRTNPTTSANRTAIQNAAIQHYGNQQGNPSLGYGNPGATSVQLPNVEQPTFTSEPATPDPERSVTPAQSSDFSFVSLNPTPSAETTQNQSPSSVSPPATQTTADPAASPKSEAKPTSKQTSSILDRGVLLPFLALGLVLGTFAIVAWWMLNSNSMSRTTDPKRSQELVIDGMETSQAGKYRDAIETFDQAIQLNPNNANAYINRGFAHHRVGDLNAAINDYNRAIELDSNSAQAYSNRSHVRFDQGRMNDAVQDATKAIELKKDLPEAHVNLGNGLFAQGDLDRAAQSLQTALDLPASNPTKARARNNLGNILLARNQIQEAGQQYDQAIQLDPSYADAFFNRGLAHERNQNWQAAAQDFAEAARLYQSQGNDRRAREATTKAEQAQQRVNTTPLPPTVPNQQSI